MFVDYNLHFVTFNLFAEFLKVVFNLVLLKKYRFVFFLTEQLSGY